MSTEITGARARDYYRKWTESAPMGYLQIAHRLMNNAPGELDDLADYLDLELDDAEDEFVCGRSEKHKDALIFVNALHKTFRRVESEVVFDAYNPAFETTEQKRLIAEAGQRREKRDAKREGKSNAS